MLFAYVQHAALTHVGMRRSHNQDNFAVQVARDDESFRTNGHLFLVADGMGGHAVGEKASAKAVSDIPLSYQKYIREGPIPAIRRAFTETNLGIFNIGQENPEFRGLGTTGSALVLRPEGAWVGHVGDSRVYRIRNGLIEQLSFDHSYVWEMARKLGVPPEDLPDIRKNVIIRSLGPDSSVDVDVEGPHPIEPGDIYVLCSDGLSGPLKPEEIGAIAGSLPPDEACKLLIEFANLRGGPDNITAIVIKVPDDPDRPASTLTPIRPREPGLPVRLFKWWFQRVPWPLQLIGIGFICAVVFLVESLEDGAGSAGMMAASVIAIITGMTGLILQARHSSDKERDPNRPGKLHIYRTHECHITKPLVGKIAELQNHLLEFITERNLDYEAERFRKFTDEAQRAEELGNLLQAFIARLRGMHLLARVINSQRNREEDFRPKWETVDSE